MRRNFFKKVALAAMMLTAAANAGAASGWPSQYEGVMLQGFFWDSYTDTKWTNLESQADELSDYFKLIWVPNSGKCGASNNMGYMPQYWFTNHNSSFGTQSQLVSMIKCFKEKGTGIIADVVINHRNGVTNWHDFPKETWDGVTWSIGLEGICSDDEMAYAAGQPKPKGNPDTGDNFDGCRDLDHTNANVQNNCKNYCRFLLEELGYAGFRYDMVKGYSGEYTKIYNNYSNPTYSVGEYWDANYDAVKGWIESTGRTSAAFDFPFKYAVNEAFSSGDLGKLVWKANGTTDQPAGMIHFGYPRYAVTFIDNHDTYRDGSKFTGNVPAANAFMLSCPGTPCVFLQHWKSHKAAIKAMIDARNAAGIHNESAVKVLRTGRDIYMAEVTGKYGTLAVKIGSAMVSPSGYSDSEIAASGTDYCIWVKASGQGPVNPPTPPTPPSGDDFTIYYDNEPTSWATPYIHYWGATASTWPGVAMTRHTAHIWKYTVPAGTTGVLFNAGDGDATKSADFEAMENYVYTHAGGPQSHIDSYNGGGGGNYPACVYLVGNLAEGNWSTTAAVPAGEIKNGVFKWDAVEIKDSGNGSGYFTFITAKGADWDEVNASDRYGAGTKDESVAPGAGATVAIFRAGVNASSAYSWKIAPGTYTFTLDLAAMRLSVGSYITGVGVAVDAAEAPVYYDLLGNPVENPSAGIYIEVCGRRVRKIIRK